MSILFMLGMVLLIPAGFGVLLWTSYCKQASAGYEPEGKVRWSTRDEA